VSTPMTRTAPAYRLDDRQLGRAQRKPACVQFSPPAFDNGSRREALLACSFLAHHFAFRRWALYRLVLSILDNNPRATIHDVRPF
jgi:hypothetical protein